MGEVMVTQDDRILFSFLLGWDVTDNRQRILDGHFDQHVKMQKIARHRQAAEKATREQDAAYIEGKGGLIPGATVFVSLITGENMPCMSGDARDKLNSHKRRQFDDATRDLATAIRSQNDG